MYKLELCGENLTLQQLKRFISEPSKVSASADALERVQKCAAFCAELSLDANRYYGINTGFGRFASQRVEPSDAGVLQENLLRSHAVGMGPDLPEHIVRLMMVFACELASSRILRRFDRTCRIVDVVDQRRHHTGRSHIWICGRERRSGAISTHGAPIDR